MSQDKAQFAVNGPNCHMGYSQGLQRRIGSFGSLPSGAMISGYLLCCAFCKGLAIHYKTRLAANRFSSR